jgi:hypothetical protein
VAPLRATPATKGDDMGLFSNKNKDVKTVGVAFTEKGRRTAALQAIVKQDNVDADGLTYTEDKGSKTAKVTDQDGNVRGRFTW